MSDKPENTTGLPNIVAIEISMPREIVDDNALTKELDKAIEAANDFIWQTYDQHYPPRIMLDRSAEDRTLYIPQYSVICDTFIKAMVFHTNTPAKLVLFIVNEMQEQYPGFNAKALASTAAREFFEQF